MNKIKSALPDLMILAGAGAVSYGCWMAYNPMGYVVAGAMVIFAAVKMANKA